MLGERVEREYSVKTTLSQSSQTSVILFKRISDSNWQAIACPFPNTVGNLQCQHRALANDM